jgi:D-3-phosphoglycerate dehydrogenase / 2-oxoglutarate reductase
MKTILVSAPYMLPHLERFKPVFEHFQFDLILPDVNERLSENEILHYAGKFDGTICGDDRYTEKVIGNCVPRLKVISKWGTGIDSIDKEAASRLGVLVCNTTNAFTLPVSDSVMGYILAFARRQPWMDREVKAGYWEKLMGCSLAERTLGVIGVGNIGKAVFRRARAFGMKLIGTDIIPIAPDFILENGVEMVSLKELLERSDYVSLNCDLNPTSYHIIDEKTLEWMKPGAILINTARGPLVKESALVSALQNNKIGGAAMDVFEIEPLPLDSPLLKLDQVLLAPHNANSSPLAWERVHWNTIRNLLNGLGIDPTGLDKFAKSV